MILIVNVFLEMAGLFISNKLNFQRVYFLVPTFGDLFFFPLKEEEFGVPRKYVTKACFQNSTIFFLSLLSPEAVWRGQLLWVRFRSTLFHKDFCLL